MTEPHEEDDEPIDLPTDTVPIQYGGFVADWQAWWASGDEGYEAWNPISRILMLPLTGGMFWITSQMKDPLGGAAAGAFALFVLWYNFSASDIRTQLQRNRHQAIGFLAANEILSREPKDRPEDWQNHAVLGDVSPLLSRINGFGGTFLRRIRFDPMTDSFITVHYLTALYVPVFPVRRFRIQETEVDSYRLLAVVPTHPTDYLPLAAWLAFFAFLTTIG